MGCSQFSNSSGDQTNEVVTSTIEESLGDIEEFSEKASSSAGASAYSTETEKWVSRRILVQPKKGINDSQVASILSTHGGKSVSKISAINVHIVELPVNANEKAIAALLAKNPNFEFAEIDAMVSPNVIANDPYYNNAWHLQKIQAPQAPPSWPTPDGAC